MARGWGTISGRGTPVEKLWEPAVRDRLLSQLKNRRGSGGQRRRKVRYDCSLPTTIFRGMQPAPWQKQCGDLSLVNTLV